MIGKTGNTGDDDKRKHETEDLKDDMLEKSMERMNEAEKMKNDEPIADEVTKALNKEHFEHVVKRVKMLIKENEK